jgi:3-oxoacyl-[acyl-carrier-protein] synthase II
MEIYIQAASAISPPKTSGQEPDYSSLIDPKSIRRMSRIIRMGVGAAAACLRDAGVVCPDAIVTGTAYGCLADTGVFLSKMIGQGEEMLPPTAFIQSTHNTVGGQIALLFQCHGYNNTFVHRGFSFESALLDAIMLLRENEACDPQEEMGDPRVRHTELFSVLIGAVDEITEFSHAILSRFGLYRNTRAGEGAAFFLLTNDPAAAWARLEGLETFYKPKDAGEIEDRLRSFLNSRSIAVRDLDLVIMGNNGDRASDGIYEQLSSSLFSGCAMIRYKDICGEYPTSASFALWLATDIVRAGAVPAAIRCEGKKKDEVRKVLIYNHYQGAYHSLILVSGCR